MGYCTAGKSDGLCPDVSANTLRLFCREQVRERQLEQRCHCLTKGDPFLQLPLLRKSGGHSAPEAGPLHFTAVCSLPGGSLSCDRVATPAPQVGRGRYGAEAKSPTGGRGGEKEGAALQSRQLSGPFRFLAAPRRGGRWLPEAPRTVTCHGDTAPRPLPR